MSVKRAFPVAGLALVAAITLAACGGAETGSSSPAAPPASNESPASAQQPADPAATLLKLAGTARSNKADEKAGDLAQASAPKSVKQAWVQLRAAKAGELNPVVVNGAGLTLYRFDKDTPGKTPTCNDDCATTWPPVTVARTGKIFLAGVRKADLAAIPRADGDLQLTIKGWPLYRFNKDTKPGDTLGHGVGGTWFGVTPSGGKASGGRAPATTAPAPDADAAPATSVTLFTGKNFDDTSGNNFATGIGGTGCKDLRANFLSLTVDGSVKLWAEPGCTGTSLVVTDDIADLTTLGFPTGPKSVRLG